MLAVLGDLQRGQASMKGSQALHEQRCLQGNSSMHEFLELQNLHTIIIIIALLFPVSRCCSSSSLSSFPPTLFLLLVLQG